MARTDIEKRETAHPETYAEPRRPVVNPPVDIYENDDELLLLVDLPGVDKQSLNIRLENDELAIEGRWAIAEIGNALGVGFRPVDYERRFTVPATIQADKVGAELKAGVLHLRLPKAEAYKPRQIQVKGE